MDTHLPRLPAPGSAVDQINTHHPAAPIGNAKVKLSRLDLIERQLLDLAEQLSASMQGQAYTDRQEFDRGARALSSLMRAGTTIAAMKDQTAREIHADDEKTLAHSAGFEPASSELDALLFESTRHLNARLAASTAEGMAETSA